LKTLPYGYEEVVWQNKPHYVYRGVYYLPFRHKGVTVYKVVK